MPAPDRSGRPRRLRRGRRLRPCGRRDRGLPANPCFCSMRLSISVSLTWRAPSAVPISSQILSGGFGRVSATNCRMLRWFHQIEGESTASRVKTLGYSKPMASVMSPPSEDPPRPRLRGLRAGAVGAVDTGLQALRSTAGCRAGRRPPPMRKSRVGVYSAMRRRPVLAMPTRMTGSQRPWSARASAVDPAAPGCVRGCRRCAGRRGSGRRAGRRRESCGWVRGGTAGAGTRRCGGRWGGWRSGSGSFRADRAAGPSRRPPGRLATSRKTARRGRNGVGRGLEAACGSALAAMVKTEVRLPL